MAGATGKVVTEEPVDGRFWPWLLAVAFIVVGVAAMSVAVQVSAPPIAGLVGVVVATVGLFLLYVRLRPHARQHPRGAYAFGLAVIAGGFALTAWAFGDVGWVVGVGVATIAVGWLPIRAALKLTVEAHPKGFALAGCGFTFGGSGLAALGLWLQWPTIVTAGSLALVLAGLSLYQFGIEPLCDPKERRIEHPDRQEQGEREGLARKLTRLGFAATAAGLYSVWAGATRFAVLPVIIGMALTYFGLLPLTIGWSRPNQDLPPLGRVWAFAIGATVVILGVLLWPATEPERLGLGVAAVLAVLALSFSFRAELFVVLVLVGFVVVWVSIDRIDPDPAGLEDTGNGRIVALGDSYTSGEGSTMFFPGTNQRGTQRNECRRSSTAYPYLVAEQLGMGLEFYACSGAKTSDIYHTGQMPRSPPGVAGTGPQLANLSGEDLSGIRAVVVSIGGNDANFGKIGEACVLPGSCAEFRENWLYNVSHIGKDITRAFWRIKRKVGKDIPIVAVPYPLLLREEGCGWSALRPSEHDFLVEFVTVLDDRIRNAAATAGINFLERGLFAFDGKKICDGHGPDDTAMNFFNLHPQEGGFVDRINPTNWIHGTFHPKPEGHQAMATILADWLRWKLKEVDIGGPANPRPDPDAEFDIRRVSVVETVLANPLSLPPDLDCPVTELTAFATLIPLIDANDPFPLHASDQDPICYTRLDGTWTTWRPGDPNGVVVVDELGDISINPELPTDDARQHFVFKEPGPKGRWQLRIAEFCAAKTGCSYNLGYWMKDQIKASTRSWVIPAMLVFIGAWLVGAALKRTINRR